MLIAIWYFLFPDFVLPFIVSETMISVFYIGAVTILILLGALEMFVVPRLFPWATFAIGQGKDRYRNLNAVRVGAISLIIFPILIELLFDLLP